MSVTKRNILERSLRRYISEGTRLSGDPSTYIPADRVIPGQTKYLIPQAGDLSNSIQSINFRNEDVPDEGLFASLEFVSEREVGKMGRHQYIGNKIYLEKSSGTDTYGKDESYTISRTVVESIYSVNFYRVGAVDAANSVRSWSSTETGLTWAATALTDGQIVGINIYDQSDSSNEYSDSDNKYKNGDQFVIEYHPDDPEYLVDFEKRKKNFARGILKTDIKGNVEFAYITSPLKSIEKTRVISKTRYEEIGRDIVNGNYQSPDLSNHHYMAPDLFSAYGNNYSILPSSGLYDIEGSVQQIRLLKPYSYLENKEHNVTLGDGSLKWAARGRGFFLSHPINVRNIAGIVSENWQERTQLDLYIQYDKIYADNDSGRIETIIGDHSSLTGRI